MSGPTIRIGGFDSLPDVSILPDFGGNTIEINNMNDFDLGLLGNQRKLIGTPPRGQSPAPRLGGFGDLVESDGIDFVNLEDTGVTFNVRPPPSGVGDTIKILRDSSEPMAPRPIGPTLTLNSGPQMSAPVHSVAPSAIPAQTSTWFTGAPAHPAAPAPASGGFASGLRSLFGGGSSSAVTAAAAGGMDASQMSASSYLTPEQESAKKTDGLTMLERMDRKGVGGTKMTIANSLEEIDAELARRKDSKALEASIRFQRSMLTTVTNGMEFLNSRYDPLGVALDGWSEQVHENVEDYDDIFEELYDKYKDKSKVAPEVRLIMSLGLSAAMCHVTNTMFKSKMPGMDDIMRKNPDLARQMAAAAAEHAVGPGFANFVSMGMPGGGGTNTPRRTQAPAQQQQQQQPPSPPPEQMGGMSGFMPSIGSSLNARIPNLDPRGAVDGGAPQATARREMRGPTGVDVNDILRTLNAAGDLPQRSVPGGLESEDHGSVGSGMTTETMRRSGQSRRRKATTTQPTGSTLTLNV
jgi:hypothetical protein